VGGGAVCLDGAQAANDPRAFSQTVNVVPHLTVVASTGWDIDTCTKSAGLGSWQIVKGPAHGKLAFRQVSAPAPTCPSGSPPLPAIEADYAWTSTNPKVTSDRFTLNFIAGGTLQATIDFSVVLTKPRITLDRVLVPAAGTVVAAGQEIDLGVNLKPARSRDVTWTVPGKPVGGYDPPAPCARPAPASCIGAVLPAPDFVTPKPVFYWIAAGTFDVGATLLLDNGATTSATAKFDVLAPKGAIKVSTDPGRTAVSSGTISCGSAGTNTVRPDPCIYFSAGLSSPFKSNVLEFVQLVAQESDSLLTTIDNQKRHDTCWVTNAGHTALSGLDEFYPDPLVAGSGTLTYAYDAPSFNFTSVGSPISQQLSVSKETFLLWRLGSEPSSIFIPLAAVKWEWTAKAAFTAKAWKRTGATIVASSLKPGVYPQWGAVLLDGQTLCKLGP
jgi:hypothetical protein